MKNNLLFIFLLMIFIIPLEVKGETFYFNYGEYEYSNELIEERKDLEVKVIVEEGSTIYKYRTRDYLIIPDYFIIKSRDFEVFEYIDTNIPLDEIEVIENYDLKTMNNCDASIEIRYKKTVIGKLISIKIKNYIDVPKEIIINSYNFDIWNYIETDINEKEDIVFKGEFDLNTNGEYELLISYNDILKRTKIIVDIEENNRILEDEKKGDINDNVEDKENIDNLDNTSKKEVIVEVITEEKQPISYINNYCEIKGQEKELEYVEKLVPINNEVNCKDTDYNKEFRYVSYAFYGIITILLSIIVVRKK